MIDKSKYNNIEIPDELDHVVNDAIFEGMRTQRKKKPFFVLKRLGTVMAVFVLFSITLLNVSPVFAQVAYNIPILGDLCRIVTIREYHFEDEIKYIDVKIPEITSTGKSDLENRLNLEIQKKINECIKTHEEVAKDYFEAYVKTGGNPDEFNPIGITVDYEIKSCNENYASFVIYCYETAFTAYNEEIYYNVDLERGRIITLKDWFGNDYKEIVADNIEKTIAEWSEEQKEVLWDDLEIIDLITENTDFYINDEGQIVIAFPKYEIAYGAAGAFEFVIKK